MKKLSLLSAVFGMAFMGAASAANITIYHSPTCPHCHHAREFINETLVYEYPNITVTEVNVMEGDNFPLFQEALTKCEYESGGVPVMVIGEKCFQGYADFMQQELRDAVEADMSDADKQAAAENKAAMEQDADAFKSAHAERANAVVENTAAAADEDVAEAAATTKGGMPIWGWILIVAVVAGLGALLVKKAKK